MSSSLVMCYLRKIKGNRTSKGARRRRRGRRRRRWRWWKRIGRRRVMDFSRMIGKEGGHWTLESFENVLFFFRQGHISSFKGISAFGSTFLHFCSACSKLNSPFLFTRHAFQSKVEGYKAKRHFLSINAGHCLHLIWIIWC